MRHVFHKKSGNLTKKDRWYLDRYLGFSEESRQAYELKEAFSSWFCEAKEKSPEGILQTKQSLYEFYRLVQHTDLPEFHKAIKTLQNWQVEILNGFSYGYSNGFLEGLNNFTKVVKRNAFGFRSY